jgi:hypothetical protein
MMIEVFEALARNGVPSGYRVVYRTNPRGEHVVAVIWLAIKPVLRSLSVCAS